MNIKELADDLVYGVMDWAVDMDETEGMDVAERMKYTAMCCSDLLEKITGKSEQHIIQTYLIDNLLEQTHDYLLTTAHWKLETPENLAQAIKNGKAFLTESKNND